MRNRRVNVYNKTNLNMVVTDYRAGTSLKNVNNQQIYKNNPDNVVPGGQPSGNVNVQFAGERISRVRSVPLGGYRKELAKNTKQNGVECCLNKTQEIYSDTWTNCSNGVCSTNGLNRTQKPLIRSGMQYNSAVSGEKKKYAFSYREYQRNLRNTTYQRNLSKFESTLNANEYAAGNGICSGCDAFGEGGAKNSASKTIYKRNNKKFNSQGAVSSGDRLERLKLETIQGTRLKTRRDNNGCQTDNCDVDSRRFTQGYRSSESRFVTNPLEGGNKTKGFVPTRWRNQYIARGKAIGNILVKQECVNCK